MCLSTRNKCNRKYTIMIPCSKIMVIVQSIECTLKSRLIQTYWIVLIELNCNKDVVVWFKVTKWRLYEEEGQRFSKPFLIYIQCMWQCYCEILIINTSWWFSLMSLDSLHSMHYNNYSVLQEKISSHKTCVLYALGKKYFLALYSYVAFSISI